MLDHAREEVRNGDWRIRALLNFAGEEAKHIHLFKRFHAAFLRGFPVGCQVIGPSEAIGAEVLRHDLLAVGLVILVIEWMTPAHYPGSVRDNGDLDPLFQKPSQASLDGGVAACQARHLDRADTRRRAKRRADEKALDEFFEIAAFLDDGLKTQAGFNLDALEEAIGPKFEDRDAIIAEQHQAARWTYIGSGMVHERFRETVQSLSPAKRIADAAPLFA